MAEEVKEVREVREVRAPVWEAETPWMVAYLREDIQDLRNEVREVRRSIQRLDEKLDDGLERLGARIDARTDELRQDMDAKIDGRAHELHQEIGELRRTMNVQFRWMLTTMVAVGALIVTILELLR